MKIPFIISLAILWIMQALSIIARSSAYSTGISQIYTIDVIVTLVYEFSIGLFFVITGIRMLKISYGMQKAKYVRVSKLLIMCFNLVVNESRIVLRNLLPFRMSRIDALPFTYKQAWQRVHLIYILATLWIA